MTHRIAAIAFAFLALLVTSASVRADLVSFTQAEASYFKLRAYFDELQDRFEAANIGTGADRTASAWANNWQFYDRERAPMGDDIDAMHGELRRLRDAVGAETANLADARAQLRLTRNEMQAVRFGDIGPGDADDIGKATRFAKKLALSFRERELERRVADAEQDVKSLQTRYEALYKRTKARSPNVYQPLWSEIETARNKLLSERTSASNNGTARPLAGELAIARERLNAVSETYLKELLQMQPPQLVRLEALYPERHWYVGEWQPDAEASPSPGAKTPEAMRRGYEMAIGQLTDDIATLDAEIDDLTRLLDTVGKGWRTADRIAREFDNTIVQSDVHLAIVNGAIEGAAVAGAFFATGGLSAAASPGMIGMLAGQAASASSSAARKAAAGAGMDALLRQAGARSKQIAAELIEATWSASQKPYLKTARDLAGSVFQRYDSALAERAASHLAKAIAEVGPVKAGLTYAAGQNYGLPGYVTNASAALITGAAGEDAFQKAVTYSPIVINDVVESVVTNGFDDFTNSYQVAKAAATGTTGQLGAETVGGAAAAGVAVVSTFLKIGTTAIHSELVGQWTREMQKHAAESGVHKARYFELVAARQMLEDDRAFKTRLRASFEALKEANPRRQKLAPDAQPLPRDDFDKIGRWSLTATFSRPILEPPLFQADGLTFGTARPLHGEAGKAAPAWIVEVVDMGGIPDDARGVRVSVALSGKEQPYARLDADPATPLQLAAITREGWRGYENGAPDTNHVLPINPDEACSGNTGDCSDEQGVPECPVQTGAAIAETVIDSTQTFVGYYHDGRDVDWGLCAFYNPVTSTCMDRTVSGNFDALCLDADGKLLLNSAGEPYSPYDNEYLRFQDNADAALPSGFGGDIVFEEFEPPALPGGLSSDSPFTLDDTTLPALPRQ
ncbi:hypothetical protein [Oricola sp.]|uniref:hypothetical protein n=1 Tax=Oricola sp. TaxID=1979950 RepID=UPI0025CDBD18|nr:hypothetical protein [Oricola sp.]MCI5076671.1 hypothetical protein [Oricola sp.]